jgi:hypothetical protein
VLVHHLGDGISQQYNVLIEGLDLTLQLYSVNEIDGNRHMLSSQDVEKRVLQKLPFVVVHDMIRVEELI